MGEVDVAAVSEVIHVIMILAWQTAPRNDQVDRILFPKGWPTRLKRQDTEVWRSSVSWLRAVALVGRLC